MSAPTASFRTFSWISEVHWASQKATVATSLSIGISTEQSLPSRSATSGLECIGPFGIGPLIDPESILGLFPGCSILAFLLSIRLEAKGELATGWNMNCPWSPKLQTGRQDSPVLRITTPLTPQNQFSQTISVQICSIHRSLGLNPPPLGHHHLSAIFLVFFEKHAVGR